MKVDDFERLYMAELEELRSVESQMIDHLGQLADQATNTTLSEAIDAHRDQTASITCSRPVAGGRRRIRTRRCTRFSTRPRNGPA